MNQPITQDPPTAEVVGPDDVQPGRAGIHPWPSSPAPSPAPDDGSAPSGGTGPTGQDDGRTIVTYDVVNPPSRPYS
jgi:hypothetical protein